MQFQVPQFIEVEDKIIGPLTFKQAIYIAGGVGLGAVCFLTLPLFLAILLAAPAAALAGALAFYTPNNQPFVVMLEAALGYFVRNKLYTWRKVAKPALPQKKELDEEDLVTPLLTPKLSESKLKELAWSLDIHEKMGVSVSKKSLP